MSIETWKPIINSHTSFSLHADCSENLEKLLIESKKMQNSSNFCNAIKSTLNSYYKVDDNKKDKCERNTCDCGLIKCFELYLHSKTSLEKPAIFDCGLYI